MTGAAGAVNVQGEDQKKLDVVKQRDLLRGSANLREDRRDRVRGGGHAGGGRGDVQRQLRRRLRPTRRLLQHRRRGVHRFHLGVYSSDQSCVPDWGADDEGVVQEKCITNVCQPGNNPSPPGTACTRRPCILMLTVGHGVYGFTLDPSIGEFVLSHEDVKIPEKGKIHSFNEGNYVNWEPGTQGVHGRAEKGGHTEDGKPYSARYIGSLVGDFRLHDALRRYHGYPGDAKTQTASCACCTQCAPMSFIAEQAGGMGGARRRGGCWTFDRRRCTSACRSHGKQGGRCSISSPSCRRREWRFVGIDECDGHDPKGEGVRGDRVSVYDK